jgi:DNA primase
MRLKIIQIPDGFAKDADECLKKDPAVWFKAVTEAQEIMEWYLALVRQRFDIANPRERQQAATLLSEELLRIPHIVERDFWMRRSADLLHLDAAVMAQEIAVMERRIKRAVSGVAPETVKAQPEIVQSAEDRQFDQLARTWWGILLAFPVVGADALLAVPPELFIGTQFFELYDFMQTTYTTNDFSIEKIAEQWSRNGRSAEFTALSLQAERDYPTGLTLAQARTELADISQRLVMAWKKKQHKELLFTMKEAERSGNRVVADQALVELQKLSLGNS